jgi:heme A synthase
MKTLRLFAFATATFAYAVIVIGFVVRITGSGMGCGDDWPLCNGAVIPSFDNVQTAIEYGHRIAVLGLTALVVLTAALAWARRHEPGGTGPGGVLLPSLLAVALLVLQSLLGALAVKLELPPHTVVLHLGAGLALLATLVLLGLRAGVHAGVTPPQLGMDRGSGGVIAAGALAALVLLMGGMTAATDALVACTGFPLCSGQVWPTSSWGGLAHIHWTHRVLAYALFLHLMGVALAFRRRKAPARAQVAAWLAFGIATAQVLVGALMVFGPIPGWRVTHATLGTGVWVAVVYQVWLVRRSDAPRSGPRAA